MGKKKSKTQKSKQRARRKQNRQETTESVILDVNKNRETVKRNSSLPKKETVSSLKKAPVSKSRHENSCFKQEKIVSTPKKENVKIEKKKDQVKKQETFYSKTDGENIFATTSKENLSFFEIFKKIVRKAYIFFNVLLVLSYIMLILSLLLVGVFHWKSILFIAGLLLFLLLVALSYTKYASGKIFSLVLILGMGLFTYKLQYTYDFIHALNKAKYEEKTYYVVTFDTSINKSVYVLNNKKIGLLTTNRTNVERKLNTELDNVTYISYDDVNDLVFSFYNQEFKAIIVNENQYKFLENSNYDREIKILYEFQAIGLKDTP